MNTVNGVTYATNKEHQITVLSVRALEGYRLWVRFSTGETKEFDFTSLLDKGVFSTLKNKDIFNSVYVDYGVPVWCNGDIDIAPERLYYDGVDV